jgi:polyhydroxyalkanoate synthesis regulator phasin
MNKVTPNVSDNLEGCLPGKTDYSVYETSFRRWLVSEIDSGKISIQEARQKFKLPIHFSTVYKRDWQPKYSDQIHLSLEAMSSKDRTDNKKLEQRIKELEKQLELAQMKNVAINTMIDIAEKDYKLEIRKKSGPKQ